MREKGARKRTPRELVRDSRVVAFAESIGFMSYGQNVTARRHFYWFMPDSNIHG